ncbi:fibronectin type III domain-containing protein [Patescibacteria group bacterium]
MTGINKNYHDNPTSEVMYGITETTAANDSQVLGAFLALTEPEQEDSVENPHLVMAVGNGDMWVVDEGENLDIGDYLISSGVTGHAMKDVGGYVVSHIVARVAEPVDWSTVTDTDAGSGKKHKRISVTFEQHDKFNEGFGLVVAATGDATAIMTGVDSYMSTITGSAWDTVGTAAVARDFTITNNVTDEDTYKLSFANNDGSEIMYLGQDGDVAISGKLYLSDEGVMQTNKYLYYDSADDYIKTNAAGWNTGSYDFAERFPSIDPLVPGELVMIDVMHREHVKRADNTLESNGYLLSGIVSTRPGFLAGMKEVGTYPVALEGRVPTKVNLENGAINIGDAVTISSTPGQGMRADGQTYVVGIALETYDGTQEDNMITVFLKNGWYNGTTVEAATTSTSGGLTGGTAASPIDMAGYPMIGIGALEGIDGLWDIDGNGNMHVKTVTADEVKATKITLDASGPNKTVGHEIIEAGMIGKLVINDAMEPESLVVVTFEGNPGSSWWIEEKTTETFMVKFAAPVPMDTPFTYWILGVEEPAPAEDTAAPVISNVQVSNITETEATITWDTDESSDSKLDLGLDEGVYTSTDTNTAMVTSHTIQVQGLSADTTYHFSARSADADGNEIATVDATFVTLASAVVQEPPAEEPVVEEPPVEEPPAEEPVVEEPPAEEPVVEEPVVQEPPVEEPPAEEPVVEEPPAEEPTP